MANDLFGGLGGLMKGLSGFMPQDDPDVKLINARTQLGDLENQETAIYAQVGRLTLAADSGRFPELEEKLRVVLAGKAEALSSLKAAEAEKDKKEKEDRLAAQQCTCPSCGFRNPEGVKFCQECGAKLGVISVCPSCGAKLTQGIRFCGECGARTGS